MPRPILKALPLDLDCPPALPFAGRVLFTPHVHFPSTPLTFTGNTHSPGSYDRAPIVVSPNSCALPERGGRVYRPTAPKGSYFHPRAYEACEAEPMPRTAVPGLLPDTSETDDASDECASPPLSAAEPPVAIRMPAMGTPYYPTPIPSTHSQSEFNHALSFLPYPPSPMCPPSPETIGMKRPQRPRPGPRRSRRSVQIVSFRDPGEGDGCLGGF
ncbi:hypothetical protein FB45DRAFT_858924 [Roridomyces roridus]|uniref:Uncharacterized protein n=1 Tax=Roridomyces roridus TaxID=1738132 RepID=A0AAD7CKR1_9AGAR|nr:hypothetical protein FB45DRAFT_858924 [Roridomyces roridus]